MRTTTIFAALLLTVSFLTSKVTLAAEDTIKIGILNDQAGPFADNGGRGSIAAARLAAEDFGNEILGKKIEIISADHQNKPDIASATARRSVFISTTIPMRSRG